MLLNRIALTEEDGLFVVIVSVVAFGHLRHTNEEYEAQAVGPVRNRIRVNVHFAG